MQMLVPLVVLQHCFALKPKGTDMTVPERHLSQTRSIDLASESPLTLATAARTLPGGSVHVSTVHRWRQKGVRGIRLETFLRGGIRYTTHEAIQRFFAATTAAADGDGNVPPILTDAKRERAIREAEEACEKAGI